MGQEITKVRMIADIRILQGETGKILCNRCIPIQFSFIHQSSDGSTGEVFRNRRYLKTGIRINCVRFSEFTDPESFQVYDRVIFNNAHHGTGHIKISHLLSEKFIKAIQLVSRRYGIRTDSTSE